MKVRKFSFPLKWEMPKSLTCNEFWKCTDINICLPSNEMAFIDKLFILCHKPNACITSCVLTSKANFHQDQSPPIHSRCLRDILL